VAKITSLSSSKAALTEILQQSHDRLIRIASTPAIRPAGPACGQGLAGLGVRHAVEFFAEVAADFGPKR